MFTIPTSKEMSELLSGVQQYATRSNHGLLTSFHTLFGLINTSYGSAELRAVGVDIPALNVDIERAFSKIAAPKTPGAIQLTGELRTLLKQVNDYSLQLGLPTIGLLQLMTILRAKGSRTGDLLVRHGGQPFSKTLAELLTSSTPPSTSKNVPSETSDAQAVVPEAPEATSDIATFTEDMTQLSAYYDPMVGRERELDLIMDILLRRTKNNPLVVGAPGVGKTALIEGLSARLQRNDVPESLQGLRLLRVDLTNLTAGAKFQGDLEDRVQALMREVTQNSSTVLFIDEIHLLGASTAMQTVANMLKPALARGRLRLIGATTRREYEQYIAKDPALARRFERVDLDEASLEQAKHMLANVKPIYEKYHDVRISDEAVEASVTLSSRYIPDRTLPDKAIDLLDHACAKVVAANEQKVQLSHVQAALHAMTGIPMESLSSTERDKLLRLESVLSERVMAQTDAVNIVANAIRRNRTGLADPSRPWGSFLFLGPTGVGKTELAKTLAQVLFDDDNALLRFDMSEYTEQHSVSRLIGAPPGYVGYEQGGLLTDGVRHQPYSVVLLDEIEKAHTDVLNLLLQVLDYGRATDGQGNAVDFRNTVLVLTSNLGAAEQLDALNGQDGKVAALHVARQTIRSELFNRIDDVLVFNRLENHDMPMIRDKLLESTIQRLALRHVELIVDSDALDFLAREGFDAELGARPMRRAIQQYVENKVASLLLESNHNGTDKITVRIGLTTNRRSTQAAVGRQASPGFFGFGIR